ncbi:MAG: NAD(+)/NADH kinase [Methanomicrobiaceae archaeon]|uniref:Nad kinase n=1 Tax=hydrocarbon metagenome TaxID=938273 RepID=A0A0W8FF12_9ZZZZ|nr:NAD(+)/NADH kinase [Methanomicrobiaceae archaeon]MDD5419284.1 NAD(+)/NADH kinase [Methanomicrobiaceae archaeon]
MKIVLASRLDKDEAVAYAASLASFLEETGHEIAFESGTAEHLGREGVPFEEFSADLVVVVGGDGSVLLAVHRMRRQIPLLGINWGEVGFLTSLEPEEVPAFVSDHLQHFTVEPRMRISLSADGRWLGNALNEAVIITSRPAKMLRFAVAINGVHTDRFRADGLLISTPTGSTAYAMSAGGPIVDPRIEGVLLVPLAPYMLSSRPHVISSDRSLQVRLEGAKPAHLVIDGQATFELERDTVIDVVKAKEPALLVNAGKHFFERVDHKLRCL